MLSRQSKLLVMKVVVLKKLRLTIIWGLMLWCAGAGCMMVSYARGAAMNAADIDGGSSSSSTWAETSGSMGTHDCCKARHKSERRAALSVTDRTSQSLANLKGLAELPNSSNAMSCCPLTSGTFVVNSRQRISDDNPMVSRGAEAVSVNSSFAATPFTVPLRLPNQNQTYLRDCVFLI